MLCKACLTFRVGVLEGGSGDSAAGIGPLGLLPGGISPPPRLMAGMPLQASSLLTAWGVARIQFESVAELLNCFIHQPRPHLQEAICGIGIDSDWSRAG